MAMAFVHAQQMRSFLPFAAVGGLTNMTMEIIVVTIQSLGGLLCRLVQILLFQSLHALPMSSPGQYAFALACGGIAYALLSKKRKWANEAEKQRKQREKRVAPPVQLDLGDHDKSSTSGPPVSSSKPKFLLTPQVEISPVRTTRPLRSTSNQQSSSFRSMTSARVTKPIHIHKGISRSAPRPSKSRFGCLPPTTTTTHVSRSRSPPSTAQSPKIVQCPTASWTEENMKSPPLQAGCHEQPTESCVRRRSSNFQFSPEVTAQLGRLDPKKNAPESVYNAICGCLQRSGIAQPSTFYIHMAMSLLKHEPDQSFYDYLSGKQAEEMQSSTNHGLGLSLAEPRMQTEDCYTGMMSGAVQPADAHLLDPRTRRRPRYIVPENNSATCDNHLPFREQVRLQPSKLLNKIHLWSNFSTLFFEPERCFGELDDEYYTTNLGLEIVLRISQAIGEKAGARLDFTSDEQERANIMGDADRSTLVWLYRLGGYFDLGPETCHERGNVRYPEDLIPFSEPPADREGTEPDRYFWDHVRMGAMRFWGRVGFEGEYDEQGYIPGNGSAGNKWWRAHSR